MPNNLITCPSCQRDCVPRLWHYRPALSDLRYMKTQHICPFCGAVMFETGGQLSPKGFFAVYLFLIPIALTFAGSWLSAEFSLDKDGTQLVLMLGYMAVLMIWVGRFLYRAAKPVMQQIAQRIKPQDKG